MSISYGYVAYEFLRCRKLSVPVITTNDIAKIRKPQTRLKRTNEGVVSKETVVLRRWGSSIQKFVFINGDDNVNWPPYRDSKS